MKINALYAFVPALVLAALLSQLPGSAFYRVIAAVPPALIGTAIALIILRSRPSMWSSGIACGVVLALGLFARM